MKKTLLLFSLLVFNCSLIYGQWVSGGTQVSFAPNNSHHRAFVSAAANGSYYVVWQATDTTTVKTALNHIRLAYYDSNAVLRPGWKVGGDSVTRDTGDYYGAQLITSEDGGAIVTWYGYTPGNNYSHVFAQKYSAAGVALWNSGNPVQVSTGATVIDEYPMIVTDMHKGFYVSWTRFEHTITPDSADVYLQHIDSTGSVATGWNANGTGVAITKGLYEYYPKLALTPNGKSVYVMYAAGLIGATSLIIKNYNAATGALAVGWSASGVTISSGPNVYVMINHDMALYTDNSNNALAVWVEAVYSGNGEIYMQQISPTGSLLLNGGTEKYLFGDTTTASGDNGIDYVEVIQEADKDLLISYNNLITFNDVAAMKVKPNGVILWDDSLITTGGKSAYPYPALDGHGGLYLFYVNANTPERLYGLGIDSTGKMYKGWSLPGSSFGTINNYDGFDPNYDQNAVGTNKGEAVVAWNRVVGKTFTIFTCNLLSTGSNCLSPVGVDEIVSTKDGYTLYPNPASEAVNIAGSYEGMKVISIYNIVGQELSTTEREGKQISINTSSFPTGMYFVNIKEISTGHSYTLKLIKN
jgi:hypothetical protein